MSSRPRVTIALIAISVCVYFLATFSGDQMVISPLLITEYYRPVLPEIKNGEVWRLVSPVFLHFGIFHIVFNMLWTWELGRLIETRQGAMSLVILTLILSVTSNLSQYFVSGPLFGGMSGVIYGYFGYVWMQSKFNPRFGIILNPAVVKLMLGWFLICWSGLLEQFFGISVANIAHTSGLLGGIVWAFFVIFGFPRLAALIHKSI